MHIWKEIILKKGKFNINRLNDYFQIKHIAEPLTKPYTKSYGHVFYYYKCFLNKQIEPYMTFIEQYDTFCHHCTCVSHFILTLPWDKNLLLRSQRQNFLQKLKSPPIHLFHSVFYAIFTLNSNNAILRQKITTLHSSQTEEVHFLKLHAATNTKYKIFFKLYPFFSIILLIKNLVFTNMLFSHSIYLHKQEFSCYKIFR